MGPIWISSPYRHLLRPLDSAPAATPSLPLGQGAIRRPAPARDEHGYQQRVRCPRQVGGIGTDATAAQQGVGTDRHGFARPRLLQGHNPLLQARQPAPRRSVHAAQSLGRCRLMAAAVYRRTGP